MNAGSPADKPVEPPRSLLRKVWQHALDFNEHDPLTLAASVAFYSALSFAPITVISMWLASTLSPGSEQKLVSQLGALLGPQVADVARLVVHNSKAQLFTASAAGAINLVTLLVSASTSFAQLQTAINRIWGVSAEQSNAVWSWIRQRLLSFGMIAVIGFLLIVTLVASSALTVVLTRQGSGWAVANEVAALFVFAVAFAALFRFVPDARAPWPFTIAGGIATALLFEGGKTALGAYLASTASVDAYGAASSIILLLIWVYYSSLIVLVGAAITRAIADIFGKGVRGLGPTDGYRTLADEEPKRA